MEKIRRFLKKLKRVLPYDPAILFLDIDPEKTKNEIIAWIQKYFEENGPSCTAVIGISGGKDSSVAAALCASPRAAPAPDGPPPGRARRPR